MSLNAVEQSIKDLWIQELGEPTLPPEEKQFYNWLAHGESAVRYAITSAGTLHRFNPTTPLHLWKMVSSISKRRAQETGYVRPSRSYNNYTRDVLQPQDEQPAFDAPAEWLDA